jgi:16S rRNA (cytosine967-C5)-methyltransferase
VGGEKPREIAARVLAADGSGAFAEQRLEQALASARLSPPDRALCQELVYGVIRQRSLLDWLIDRKVRSAAPAARIRDLLRLGLYQIFCLDRIPGHAAVHETVEAAKNAGFGRQAGFVNAVLRRCLRELPETRLLIQRLDVDQPNIAHSHPQWLFDRWSRRWGRERAIELMRWNNQPPKTFARLNTLKTDGPRLIEQWREEGVAYDFVTRDWFPQNEVFELKWHPPLDRLASFQRGWFYVQDPSTLLSIHELAPGHGETILDMCAAPGGKLCYAAQLMKNEGIITGQDISEDRLGLIRENCQRLGVASAEVELVPPPGKPVAQSSRRYDRILVDAPCSNTGVMRRRVELRWRISESEIKRLQGQQLDLLTRAAILLKSPGKLVYSTCSLEAEENEQVIEGFLAHHPDFVLDHHQLLTPFENQVDGAFVAVLRNSK